MDRATRDALRHALLAHAPWLGAEDVGPRAVEAGRCEVCDDLPRLLPTCGPTGGSGVCRACAEVLGDDGWCLGHQQEGAAARAWAADLPERWAELVVLWWVATGELRAEASLMPDPRHLPAPLAAALGELPS